MDVYIIGIGMYPFENEYGQDTRIEFHDLFKKNVGYNAGKRLKKDINRLANDVCPTIDFYPSASGDVKVV